MVIILLERIRSHRQNLYNIYWCALRPVDGAILSDTLRTLSQILINSRNSFRQSIFISITFQEF